MLVVVMRTSLRRDPGASLRLPVTLSNNRHQIASSDIPARWPRPRFYVCDALPDEREAVVSDRTMSSADSVLEDIQTAIEDPTEIHDFLVGERGAP
jgi:hypothetical protein